MFLPSTTGGRAIHTRFVVPGLAPDQAVDLLATAIKTLSIDATAPPPTTFAYKSLNDKDTLHIRHYMIRTRSIYSLFIWRRHVASTHDHPIPKPQHDCRS